MATNDQPETIPYHIAVVKTFALYAVIRTLAQMCDYIGAALLDSINFGLIEKHSVPKSGIGINRFWQTAGAALGPPFAGVLIDFFSTKYGEKTYFPGFLTNAFAGLLCAIFVSFMEVPKDVKAHSMIKNIRVLFRHAPFLAFMVAVTLLGKSKCEFERFSFGTLT